MRKSQTEKIRQPMNGQQAGLRTTGKMPRGFALVVTISLLVLLSLVAVGLLSLSTVSVRSSQTGEAGRIARANAKLALMLALDELQKTVGDDRRITAEAALIDSEASQPGLVGVWQSWSPGMVANPTGLAPDYEAEKKSRFLRWLGSGPVDQREDPNWAIASQPGDGDPVLFDLASGAGEMRAPRVGVSSPRNAGAMAWAVIQENTRAKINVAGPETGERMVNDDLQAQPRPSVALSNLLEQPSGDWNRRAFRVLTYPQAELDQDFGAGGDPRVGRAHFSTSAMGLATNVVEGGLKVDLSLGMELDENDFNAERWAGTDGEVSKPVPWWKREALQGVTKVSIPAAPLSAVERGWKPQSEAQLSA